ncbi:hypothetical protein GALL_62450 [mine drainage metagenome]|uniref:Uncharacterized protein n=1 Tax=mine drainage metagenome TaxID=410659 RepID=A0A1J5SVK6_9ZZZZ
MLSLIEVMMMAIGEIGVIMRIVIIKMITVKNMVTVMGVIE